MKKSHVHSRYIALVLCAALLASIMSGFGETQESISETPAALYEEITTEAFSPDEDPAGSPAAELSSPDAAVPEAEPPEPYSDNTLPGEPAIPSDTESADPSAPPDDPDPDAQPAVPETGMIASEESEEAPAADPEADTEDSAPEPLALIIPESVRQIPENAYDGWSRLIAVTLPEKLERIGSYAFRGTSITGITIPAAVESIGSGAFNDCLLLETVRIEGMDTVPCRDFPEQCTVIVYRSSRAYADLADTGIRLEVLDDPEVDSPESAVPDAAGDPADTPDAEREKDPGSLSELPPDAGLQVPEQNSEVLTGDPVPEENVPDAPAAEAGPQSDEIPESGNEENPAEELSPAEDIPDADPVTPEIPAADGIDDVQTPEAPLSGEPDAGTDSEADEDRLSPEDTPENTAEDSESEITAGEPTIETGEEGVPAPSAGEQDRTELLIPDIDEAEEVELLVPAESVRPSDSPDPAGTENPQPRPETASEQFSPFEESTGDSGDPLNPVPETEPEQLSPFEDSTGDSGDSLNPVPETEVSGDEPAGNTAPAETADGFSAGSVPADLEIVTDDAAPEEPRTTEFTAPENPDALPSGNTEESASDPDVHTAPEETVPSDTEEPDPSAGTPEIPNASPDSAGAAEVSEDTASEMALPAAPSEDSPAEPETVPAGESVPAEPENEEDTDPESMDTSDESQWTIAFRESSTEIGQGEKYTPFCYTQPSGLPVTFISSKPNIAEVDSNGRITGKKVGSCTVTASLPNGNIASISVKVMKAPSSVRFSSSKLTLCNLQDFTPPVTLSSSSASHLTYTSSDESVLYISSENKVDVCGVGTAKLTVQTFNNKKATCTITVMDCPEDLTMSVPELTLNPGDHYTLSARLTPATSYPDLTWISHNPSVVTVSKGKITAKKVGTALIEAKTFNGISAVCVVTVLPKPTSVKLPAVNAYLEPGDTYQLLPYLVPEDAYTVLKYSSSNSGVARVDANGLITAVKKGTAKITVKTSNYKSVTCTVKVTVLPVSIRLNFTSLSLAKGDSAKLICTLKPSDADKGLTYTSDDKTIATVGSDGKITAKGIGQTVIRVRTINGLEEVCTVTVFPQPTKVTLSETSLFMEAGNTTRLYSSVFPEDAYTKLTYSSSNSKIVTVTQDGVITAVKKGSATVQVKTSNGKTAKCTVKVVIYPTRISLDKTSLSLAVKNTATLKASVGPSGAENGIIWISSDPSIAAVSTSGKVTAKAVGTAVITARSVNALEAVCNVTVRGIQNVPAKITIGINEKYPLDAELYPASSAAITYKSSSTSVATVSADGVITAKKAGTAKITVKASGAANVVCEVKVKKFEQKLTLSYSSLSIAPTVTRQVTCRQSPDTGLPVTWSVGDSSIATVNSSGLVKAVSRGVTYLYASTSASSVVRCQIRVEGDAPGITVSPDILTMETGKTFALSLTSNPAGRDLSDLVWTSSNRDVASVSNGVVTAKTPGKAVITASCGSDSTSCTVTVIQRVTRVDLSATFLTIYLGDSYTFNPYVYPSNATNRSVSWSFDSTSNIVCEESGSSMRITARKPGKCLITCTSDDRPDISCTCEINIITPTYRALLIGQTKDGLKASANDVSRITNRLKTVNYGLYQTTSCIDLTTSEVRDAIRRTFAKNQETDVSLFVYSSHGDAGKDPVNAGALSTVDGSITTATLASWLSEVKGKVIVIICACGSGAFIYSDVQAQQIITSFEAADPGIAVVRPQASGGVETVVAMWGELRTSKFCVITASAFGELGYALTYPDNHSKDYGYLLHWFLDALGTGTTMTADTDKNGLLTLNELYTYISTTAAKTPIKVSGKTSYQTPQVYPENSDYIVFIR